MGIYTFWGEQNAFVILSREQMRQNLKACFKAVKECKICHKRYGYDRKFKEPWPERAICPVCLHERKYLLKKSQKEIKGAKNND